MSLGKLEDGKLEQLEEAISKHTDKISVLNLAKDVDISDTYILGPLLTLERMINTLGCPIAFQCCNANTINLSLILKK